MCISDNNNVCIFCDLYCTSISCACLHLEGILTVNEMVGQFNQWLTVACVCVALSEVRGVVVGYVFGHEMVLLIATI